MSYKHYFLSSVFNVHVARRFQAYFNHNSFIVILTTAFLTIENCVITICVILIIPSLLLVVNPYLIFS
jgi:hypothetical protein